MARGNTRHLIVALNLMAGLPFGIFFEAMPTYMRTQQCSLTQIGLTALAQLPWSCKILWSPFVDRYGRLDRWLRAAQCALGLVFAGLLLRHGLPEGRFVLLLLWAMATASAVQDTVCDAAFVHLSAGQTVQEMARQSSLRISSYKLAMMASGGGAILLGAAWGWRNTFGLLGVVALVSAVVMPGRLRTMARTQDITLQQWGAALWQWLSAKGAWGTFGYILLYKLGLATLSPMTKPYWVDSGVPQALLGTLSATIGLFATVGGALLMGLFNSKRGLVTPLVVGSVAEACACLLYAAAVHLPPSNLLVGLCLFVEGMAQGMATAALMLLLARICDARQAATQFAALTATFGMTRACGGVLGGFLAQDYGYGTLFTLLPLTCLWSVLLLQPVRIRLGVSRGDAATP